jgi:CspA family cold shock protein
MSLYYLTNTLKRVAHYIVYPHSMSSDRQTGRVKWFNKKSGYGFLTACGESSEYKDKDIFAHFSSLRGEDEQYKYLVQGEYVEFSVVESKGEKHEFQAASISGVFGGHTMCDTHRDNPRPPTRAWDDNRASYNANQCD